MQSQSEVRGVRASTYELAGWHTIQPITGSDDNHKQIAPQGFLKGEHAFSATCTITSSYKSIWKQSLGGWVRGVRRKSIGRQAVVVKRFSLPFPEVGGGGGVYLPYLQVSWMKSQGNHVQGLDVPVRRGNCCPSLWLGTCSAGESSMVRKFLRESAISLRLGGPRDLHDQFCLFNSSFPEVCKMTAFFLEKNIIFGNEF